MLPPIIHQNLHFINQAIKPELTAPTPEPSPPLSYSPKAISTRPSQTQQYHPTPYPISRATQPPAELIPIPALYTPL